MKIVMKHDSGVTKEVKVGFSWTVFFFGGFVPLIRGDIKWFAIMLLLSILVGSFTLGIGSLVVGIVFSFIYNKLFIKELLLKGYKPSDENAKEILVKNGIMTA